MLCGDHWLIYAMVNHAEVLKSTGITLIMRLAPLYQQDREKAVQEGLQQGLQQGMQRGMQREGANLVLRLLNRRLGQISASLEEQICQLPVEQLEDLGEALLDFDSEADLLNWLGR
jgi:predicted transposase YdaD